MLTAKQDAQALVWNNLGPKKPSLNPLPASPATGLHIFFNLAILDGRTWIKLREQSELFMIKTEKKLFLSTGWLKTLDLMAIMATVEKIITYALGEHNPGSAPDGRTSSEFWSLVLLYITFHSCFYKKEFQFLFRKKRFHLGSSFAIHCCHWNVMQKCH